MSRAKSIRLEANSSFLVELHNQLCESLVF